MRLKMGIKPLAKRRLIDFKRIPTVVVSAWPLPGGAAREKHGRPLAIGQAREVPFLECGRRDTGDLAPVDDCFRGGPTALAKDSVRLVAPVLKPEQFQREFVKLTIGPHC